MESFQKQINGIGLFYWIQHLVIIVFQTGTWIKNIKTPIKDTRQSMTPFSMKTIFRHKCNSLVGLQATRLNYMIKTSQSAYLPSGLIRLNSFIYGTLSSDWTINTIVYKWEHNILLSILNYLNVYRNYKHHMFHIYYVSIFLTWTSRCYGSKWEKSLL